MASLFLTCKKIAKLTGESPRTVKYWAGKGEYGEEHTKVVTGIGGKHYEISIHSDKIPDEIRASYLATLTGTPLPPPTSSSAIEDTALFLNKLPSFQRGETEKWLHIMNTTSSLHSRAEVEAFCSSWNEAHPTDKPITASTWYRKRREFEADGVRGLVPGWGATRGKYHSTKDDLYNRFKDLYLKQTRPSAYACWSIVRGEQVIKNPGVPVEIPTPTSFINRIKAEFTIPQISFARYGQAVTRAQWGYHIVRDWSGVLAGSYWCSDHAQSDVMVRMPDGKLGFPWYTVWIDAKSNKWLGWCIHEEDPNSDHIFEAFYRAGKKYGVPSDVLIDNGKDYRARDLSGGRRSVRVDLDETQVNSLFANLEISVHFAKPYNAQAKPIERTFSKVNAGFSRFSDTYRGPNILQKPENMKENAKKEVISYNQFCEVFDKYIEKIYNLDIAQRGRLQGKSPDQVFAAEYPDAVKAGSVHHITEAALARYCRRIKSDFTIKGNGIWYGKLNSWYFAEWMPGCVGEKVYMRLDKDDIETPAMVFNAETDEYLGQAYPDIQIAANATTDEEKLSLRKALETQARYMKSLNEATSDVPFNSADIVAARAANNRDLNRQNGFDSAEVPEVSKNYIATDMDRAIVQDKAEEKLGTSALDRLVADTPQPRKRRTNQEIWELFNERVA